MMMHPWCVWLVRLMKARAQHVQVQGESQLFTSLRVREAGGWGGRAGGGT